MAFAMAAALVLLHHGASCDFFRSLPIPPGPLRAFLDVLVLALLFVAHTAKVLGSRHLTFSFRQDRVASLEIKELTDRKSICQPPC